jgi:hypothetical protein
MALAKNKWLNVIGGWKRHLWKWDMAQKIKLFIWLSSENKILTWDTLQKKGWQSPNRCHLCSKYVESVYHLFVSCSFCWDVWLRIKKELNYLVVWEGSTLSDCFENWVKKEVVFITLALHSLLVRLVGAEQSNLRRKQTIHFFCCM